MRQFGTGESARLGDSDIRRRKEQVHPIGKADGIQLFPKPGIPLQLPKLAFIFSADHHDEGIPGQTAQQLEREGSDRTAPDGAAHHQHHSARLGQMQLAAGHRGIHMAGHGRIGGNAERQQFFLRDTPGGKLLYQSPVGNDPVIGGDLIDTGAAGIIGGNKVKRLFVIVFPAQAGEHLRRENMRGDDRIKAALQQITIQPGYADRVHLVLKGSLILLQHALFLFAVAHAVNFGEIAIGYGMQMTDRLRKMARSKGKGICHRTGMTPGFQLPAQCRRCGVMSAAGITGQDQDPHTNSGSFLLQRFSRVRSRGRL